MELVMDRTIVWDSSHLKEIDQAKKKYISYRKQGYLITKDDKKTIIDRFNPMFEAFVVIAKKVKGKKMTILTEKGDERIVWDMDNGLEAKQAKNRFVKLLKEGFKAYSVNQNGEKNRRITEFDVEAEEILLIPQTIKG
jgi:hypothetical protein